MQRIRIDIDRAPERLREGLRQIILRRPKQFSRGRGLVVTFAQRDDVPGYNARYHADDSVAISYTRPTDAFRALGRVLAEAEANHTPRDFAERCSLDLLGVLVDHARNGVLKAEQAEDLMCTMALMGFNGYTPYFEDTYEVPGEPFFGYLRGRVAQEELKRLDDFAFNLGIEVIPCVQTLGHLEQVLQWPAYADLRDVPAVLLADYEPSYELLEKMITAVMKPLRSKRIYSSMDEAHGMGTGRYRAKFGIGNTFDIFQSHMKRVVKICNKLGLKPMTSGDMYFRIGSKKNDYYDTESVIPTKVAKNIPKEMGLVYWDYYHTEPAFYFDWIARHRKMGKEPIISGGVWVWSHFWAALPFSMKTTDALMHAAKESGLRDNVCCLWGDDGMECDLLSALPGLQYYADHAYGEKPDRKQTAINLRGTCGADLEAWSLASEIDQLPTLTDPEAMPGNCSKWLLWEDPILGFLQPQLGRTTFGKHYADLAKKLSDYVKRGGIYRRLRFPAQIAKVLSLKVGMQSRLSAAMKAGDKPTLRSILKKDLAALRREVDALWRIHREVWLELYKPFGLEVLDGRYGQLRTRLETLRDRLTDFLAGRIDDIPELQTRLQRIFPEEDVYSLIDHARASTPSMIK